MKLSLPHKLLISSRQVLLVTLLCVGRSSSALDADLQLQLSIEQLPSTTSTYRLHATLLNQGLSSATLSVGRPYFQASTMEAYMLNEIELETDPPTHCPTAQTMSMSRNEVPDRVLGPGERMEVNWHTECGCLKPRGITLLNKAPCLVEPGLYHVKASFAVPLKSSHSRANLQSRPVPFAFGGSQRSPVRTMAKVTGLNTRAGTASMDAGLAHGVIQGQTFISRPSLNSKWILRVTEADPTSCTAMFTYEGVKEQNVPSQLSGLSAWRDDTDTVIDCRP